MLIRLSLIVAIIAGLAVAGLNFITVKDKVTTLKTNLATETAGRQKAETELASTRNELDKTSKELASTKQTLETTTAEKDQALADLATQTKRAESLNTELVKTRGERDAAQQELAAYAAVGVTPQQVIQMRDSFKGLQENLAGARAENKLLGQKIVKLENELAVYRDPEFKVALPVALKGKILVSDPKWNFVVINLGQDQGMLEHSELLVNRDGKLVAKVRVRTVQKDRSIANVVNGWQLGEVMEGDLVIPAHPAS